MIILLLLATIMFLLLTIISVVLMIIVLLTNTGDFAITTTVSSHNGVTKTNRSFFAGKSHQIKKSISMELCTILEETLKLNVKYFPFALFFLSIYPFFFCLLLLTSQFLMDKNTLIGIVFMGLAMLVPFGMLLQLVKSYARKSAK